MQTKWRFFLPAIVFLAFIIAASTMRLLHTAAHGQDNYYYSVIKYRYQDVIGGQVDPLLPRVTESYIEIAPLVEKIIKWPSKTICEESVILAQKGIARPVSAGCIKGDGRFNKYFVALRPNGEFFLVYSLKDRYLVKEADIGVKYDYEIMIAKAMVLHLGDLIKEEQRGINFLCGLVESDARFIDPYGRSGKRSLIVDARVFTPTKEVFPAWDTSWLQDEFSSPPAKENAKSSSLNY